MQTGRLGPQWPVRSGGWTPTIRGRQLGFPAPPHRHALPGHLAASSLGPPAHPRGEVGSGPRWNFVSTLKSPCPHTATFSGAGGYGFYVRILREPITTTKRFEDELCSSQGPAPRLPCALGCYYGPGDDGAILNGFTCPPTCCCQFRPCIGAHWAPGPPSALHAPWGAGAQPVWRAVPPQNSRWKWPSGRDLQDHLKTVLENGTFQVVKLSSTEEH